MVKDFGYVFLFKTILNYHKMKLLLTAILLATSAMANAQTKRVKVSEYEIGKITCSVDYTINLESKDTAQSSIVLAFQNMEYQHITDIAIILFFRSEIDKINQFINDLRAAEKEMDSRQSIDWIRDRYGLTLYDFNNHLYVREPQRRGKAYTVLNKKQVGKLIEWMEANALK